MTPLTNLLLATLALGLGTTTLAYPTPLLASSLRPRNDSSPAPATCLSGYRSAAEEGPTPYGYAILDYARITPASDGGEDKDWKSYGVEKGWGERHFVSGPHYLGYTHFLDPIGPWKCRFECEACDKCSSFFAWYENIGTPNEHMKCVLFDAVVLPSAFVKTNGTIASGAYDKLCPLQPTEG
ncbi:hypothetical protein VTJ49DRAFT_6309 [Mycothermus thermophilus]|uniref:Uncharacterized protein n=1 Tax=Humicola insolens TaxID=85995 RepID=A0ABR3VJP6_HUMIN